MMAGRLVRSALRVKSTSEWLFLTARGMRKASRSNRDYLKPPRWPLSPLRPKRTDYGVRGPVAGVVIETQLLSNDANVRGRTGVDAIVALHYE